MTCLAGALSSPAAAQDSTAERPPAPVDIHGFVEAYYRTGDPTIKDGYRLRKGDIKLSGEISPRLHWRIGFDAAKALTLDTESEGVADSLRVTHVAIDQKSRIVQDVALTYTVNHRLSLDVGQQLIPLSLEGTIPTPNVETIERTMFIVERSRGTGLGDVRDVGASANGLTPGGVEYHVGLFNETGESQGTIDANDQKAVVARAAFHPSFLPGFQIGGSGAFESGPIPQRRERAGGELQYRTPRLTLRGEAMTARDGELRRFGWYGLGAFRPVPAIQLVGRWDEWDRDRGAETAQDNAFERQIVGGASYLIDGSVARVVVNIVRQTFPNISTVPNATFALVAFEALW